MREVGPARLQVLAARIDNALHALEEVWNRAATPEEDALALTLWNILAGPERQREQ